MVHWDYQLFTYCNDLVGFNHTLDVIMILIARWGIFLYPLILGYLSFPDFVFVG